MLTDIAGEYLENLGRTLRMYADRYAGEMSVEELILHTLRENGGASVASLETYVVDEVERYGGRLEDMLRRNRAAYRERLNVSAACCRVLKFYTSDALRLSSTDERSANGRRSLLPAGQ